MFKTVLISCEWAGSECPIHACFGTQTYRQMTLHSIWTVCFRSSINRDGAESAKWINVESRHSAFIAKGSMDFYLWQHRNIVSSSVDAADETNTITVRVAYDCVALVVRRNNKSSELKTHSPRHKDITVLVMLKRKKIFRRCLFSHNVCWFMVTVELKRIFRPAKDLFNCCVR